MNFLSWLLTFGEDDYSDVPPIPDETIAQYSDPGFAASQAQKISAYDRKYGSNVGKRLDSRKKDPEQ